MWAGAPPFLSPSPSLRAPGSETCIHCCGCFGLRVEGSSLVLSDLYGVLIRRPGGAQRQAPKFPAPIRSCMTLPFASQECQSRLELLKDLGRELGFWWGSIESPSTPFSQSQCIPAVCAIWFKRLGGLLPRPLTPQGLFTGVSGFRLACWALGLSFQV